MKMAKILSAVAATAVAAAALATTASAGMLSKTGTQPWVEVGGNNCMIHLVNTELGIDHGVDLSSINSVTFEFTVEDTDFFDGGVGGCVALSVHNTTLYPSGSDMYNKFNWNNCGPSDWWGVTDEAAGIDTTATDKAVTTKALGDYTYSVTQDLDLKTVLADFGAEPELIRVVFQEWGNAFGDTIVTKATFTDYSGNVVLSMDGDGNILSAAVTGGATDTNTDTPAGDKGSPDTGVESVAAVAGLAVVAAGAVVLSRKRK